MKLSISNEGLEYYRNRIQQSGQEKYDDVVQRKELLASKKKSVILIIVMKFKRRQHSRIKMLIQEKSALNITDKANNYVKAYAELYDEIVKGYENGTREIYVADENAPRKLTKDEELSNLDAAYKKNSG